MHELTYLLIKLCEAKGISNSSLLKAIFTSDEEEDKEYIAKSTERLFKLLSLTHSRDKEKINILFEILFEHKNRDREEFEDKIKRMFDSIIIYSEEEIAHYRKKLGKLLRKHETYIKSVVNLYDSEESGFIRFEGFRKVMENKEFKIKDSYLDFMIFHMKQFEEGGKRLDELKYSLLFELKGEAEPSESVSEAEEEEVLISNEEYNKRVNGIVSKIAEILKEKKTTAYKFFKETLKIDESMENGKVDYVLLPDFVKILNKEGIELDDVDSYCIYNKLKFVENYDAVNIGTLSILLESFGVFEYTTSMSQEIGALDIIKNLPDDLVLNKLNDWSAEEGNELADLFKEGERTVELLGVKEFMEELNKRGVTKAKSLSGRVNNLICTENEGETPLVSLTKLRSALLEEKGEAKPSGFDLEDSKSLMDINLAEEVYDKCDKNLIKKDRLASGKGRRENLKDEVKDEEKVKYDSFEDLNGCFVNRF